MDVKRWFGSGAAAASQTEVEPEDIPEDWPYCARCRRPYDKRWDSCPRCAAETKDQLKRISSNVGTIEVIVVLMFLLALLGGCASFMNGL